MITHRTASFRRRLS